MNPRKFNIFNAILLSRSERSGLLSLLTIPAFSLVFHYTLPTRFDGAAVDPAFIVHYIEAPAAKSEPPNSLEREEAFFGFNPNEISKSDWVSLGLSPYQADGVMRFKNRIGGFKSKRDLERVYVLPEGWFARHKADIELPDDKPHRAKPQYTDYKSKTTSQFAQEFPTKAAETKVALVELNAADSLDLMDIRGVGAKSARQIIRYREALGGFRTLDQLTEIRYLHPNVLQKLMETVRVDSSLVRPMNLNEVTVDDLAKHPYLSWKMAQSIIDMRKHRKRFNRVDELLEHHRMTDSLFLLIRPYIYVE
jgi:competence protein ComEA